MDFSAFPPEINSGLIYAGPGAGPLIEAGQAWNMLAVELSTAAAHYQSTIAEISTIWTGPSSLAMIRTATGYGHWLTSTALSAELTAAQASAAAAVYESAFAATVPPPVIAVNRTLLLQLVATNLLGQNTPAIATVEAQYAEMWAQDAAAMNAYAAASSAATAGLPQFTPAPQTTTGSSPAAPAAPPAQTTLLQFIQQLIPGFTPGDPLGNLADLLTSPIGLGFISSGAYLDSGISLLVGLLGFSMITAATTESARAIANAGHATGGNTSANVTVPAAEPVKAATGNAGRWMGAATPPSWAQPPPQNTPYTPSAPAPRDRDRYQAAIPAVPFMPVTGMRSNQAKVRAEPEYGHVSKVLPPRNPSGG